MRDLSIAAMHDTLGHGGVTETSMIFGQRLGVNIIGAYAFSREDDFVSEVNMRVVMSLVSLVVGLFSLWVAYTGKPVYGTLNGSALLTPMPARQGRVMAAIVGVGFLLFFLLTLFIE